MNVKPIVVALDADDVIFKTVERWLELFEALTGLTWRKNEIKSWDIASELNLSDIGREKLYGILGYPHFYERIELYAGVLAATDELHRRLFDIHVVTAGEHPGKEPMLRALGILRPGSGTLHVLEDKSDFECDIMVDDKLETLIAHYDKFPNTMHVLFSQPWNQLVEQPDIFKFERAKDWNDVMQWISGYEQMRGDFGPGDRLDTAEDVWGAEHNMRNRGDPYPDVWPQVDDLVTQDIGFIERNQADNALAEFMKKPWAKDILGLDSPLGEYAKKHGTPVEYHTDLLDDELVKIEANERGGLQSHVEGAYRLIDPLATKVLAEVFAFGVNVRGYPEGNWRLIPEQDHVNHALNHVFQYLAQVNGLPHEEGEDHLAHAMWRLHAAVAIREGGGR